MLKISDILKKAKVRKNKEGGGPSPKPAVPESSKAPESKKAEIARRVKKHPPEDTLPKKSSGKEKAVPVLPIDSDEAIGKYETAIALLKDIMEPLAEKRDDLIDAADNLIENIIELLKKDDSALMGLFFRDYEVLKEYVYQHSINVCVLALRIGLNLECDFGHLKKLGMAALLHDLGQLKFESLVNKPRKLEQSEYEKIKSHPAVGRDILKKFARKLDLKILDVIYQEHERINGTGYPQGLSKDMIADDAKLIGMVDVYEALVHSRPHRSKFGGHEAIQMIIKEKSSFEYNLIKVLIDTIGLFPLGTLVELNTKEIGIVVNQNPKMPLKPIIDITHNINKQKLSKPKRVDLSKNYAIYIKQCFDELQD
ncbi:MAG: HD domain-containing phosphohydrolase [Candidatus Omnitrophota bacterium]